MENKIGNIEVNLANLISEVKTSMDGIITDPKTIILFRRNLLKCKKDQKFKDVELMDFKYNFNPELSYEENNRIRRSTYMCADLIVFIDDFGKTKILKSRWGNRGEVV